MKILFYLLLITLYILSPVKSEGFVEEVKCSSGSMTVVLNRTDPDFIRWQANSESEPILYVYGKKSNPMCVTSIKGVLDNENYNLSIPYGHMCDVFLTDLEPNHSTAETTIALENVGKDAEQRPVRVNHVFCLYTKSVQTIKYNNVGEEHKNVAITGGKPKPKVEMVFRSVDGLPLRTAKAGETLELYVSLKPDEAYRGMFPKECFFSNREDMESPDARRFTFVQSSCPVDESSDLIEPLSNVNDEVYFSKFKTFRFKDQPTVFVHCSVQVCLNPEECERDCFKKVTNSNLTANRLGFRRKRDINTFTKNAIDEVSLVSSLKVLDDYEDKLLKARSIELKHLEHETIPIHILICVISLAILCCISTISTCILYRKLRRSNKLNDVPCYTSYNTDGISPTGSIINNKPIGSFHPNNSDNIYTRNFPEKWINYIRSSE